MSIKLEDLPMRARQQVMGKIAEQARERKQSKYHNVKDVRQSAAGKAIRFDSQKEARRFDTLLAMAGAGVIRELRLQHQFTLAEAYTTPGGDRMRAIRYIADFTYLRKSETIGPDGEPLWVLVVEDVKSRGTRTKEYALKRKLMREKFGITIQEV